MKTIKITLKRSLIGRTERMKKVVASMGLRKINQTVTHKDTPVIRGMIHKTSHLVEVVEVEE
jgi:large subunit ribosomal protein L30